MVHILEMMGVAVIFIIGFIIFSITMCCTFEWYGRFTDWFLAKFANVFEFIGNHFWKFIGFAISGAMMYGAIKLWQ